MAVYQRAAVVIAAVFSLASAAFGQVFSNNASIAIPSSGNATPYPSTITVSGVTNPVGGFRVRLKNFSHTYPEDVAALLVAPNGQSYQFFKGVGRQPITGVTLTFASESTAALPNPLVTGTYGATGGTDAFSGAASGFPRANNLINLFTPNVNGQWSLYVRDLLSPDAGSFAGGWEIEFSNNGFATVPPNSSAFNYQGKIDGVAGNATVDLRFSMWETEFGVDPANQIRAAVTVRGVTLNNGTFSVPVEFGTLPPNDRMAWLQVEVASPSGGAFTVLPKRQLLTNTPYASVASGLTGSVLVPDVATIGGRQLDNTSFSGSSLTIQAAGQTFLSGFGTQGGELRLKGGNNNNASASPTTGVSNGGDVALFAGYNFWGTGWHGNIRFHGGLNQPELMRIVGDTGNIGIGTTTPATKLDVRGEIALGNAGDLRPVASRTAQRLTAGLVSSTGAINGGTGFTSVRNSVGSYTVSWTAADGFGDRPAVLITPINAAADILASVQGITRNADGSGSATIQLRRSADLALVDVGFSVMLVGSR